MGCVSAKPGQKLNSIPKPPSKEPGITGFEHRFNAPQPQTLLNPPIPSFPQNIQSNLPQPTQIIHQHIKSEIKYPQLGKQIIKDEASDYIAGKVVSAIKQSNKDQQAAPVQPSHDEPLVKPQRKIRPPLNSLAERVPITEPSAIPESIHEMQSRVQSSLIATVREPVLQASKLKIGSNIAYQPKDNIVQESLIIRTGKLDIVHEESEVVNDQNVDNYAIPIANMKFQVRVK